jgi:hypothetical protein
MKLKEGQMNISKRKIFWTTVGQEKWLNKMSRTGLQLECKRKWFM